jgi:hypothetical protein
MKKLAGGRPRHGPRTRLLPKQTLARGGRTASAHVDGDNRGPAHGVAPRRLESDHVATVGPTIISDLSALSLYAWVFSAYILTQTVMLPVFGKLSDLYGRRKFLLGLVIFMGGSILSGASQNIDELIVFRAIQGVGRFQVMATLQASRARVLRLPLESAFSWGAQPGHLLRCGQARLQGRR